MTRRSTAAVAALSTLLLAGCGTRLPDSAFVGAQQQSGGGSGGGPTTALPTGPSAGGGTNGSSGGSGGAGGGGINGSSGGGGGGSSRGGGTGGAGNTASDVGVTPTTITVGNIVSQTNAFDPRAFVGPLYGVVAYVDWVNAHGGVHGRQLRLARCDDGGTGQQNTTCVHQLVDKDKVFALAGNAMLSYAGASYVNSKGVPDVGSQPIDPVYTQYPHLWDLYGEDYPRDGTTIGFGGKLYGGTEVYRYFKVKFSGVPLKAGVVYYNQADSQRYGQYIAKGLQTEGYGVTQKQVNFALPDFDSAVLAMKQAGVRYVYDSLDRTGSERLCKAMDDHQLYATRVVTTQSWEESVGGDYADSPHCRNAMYATGNTRNYEDTQSPGVADFRQQMAREHMNDSTHLSDWALEGWAGAQWLVDAMSSCGANLTRKCVEAYLARPTRYDGHGLLTPRSFVKDPSPPAHMTNCINVVRWQDGKGWVTQVPDMDRNCFDVPNISYSP